jgi:hypothetical protein
LAAQDLKERLKKEECRSKQALDVAEEASNAAGSIGRVVFRLTQTMDELERKLQR